MTTKMKTKDIVDFNVDYATYLGDENDGVYYQVGEKRRGNNRGWYMTAVVDSDTGAFVDTMVNDDGPYPSEQEALQAGENCAIEWCLNNDVNWEDEEETND